MTARALVAYGDATNVRTWSNVPYFFLQAGLRHGLFEAGITLRPDRFRRRRLLWNASRPFVGELPRGFMYSRDYLRDLWSTRVPQNDVGEFVSHYQLLPPQDVVSQPITFYIDATMRQYFADYEYPIGRRIKAEALARERDAYHSSRFVVCMNQWCADDVLESYGVPEDKVRVIIPGANITESAIADAPEWDGTLAPLRLGYIGVDWERKGGPLLVDAVERLRDMGHEVELVVIGPDPSRIPDRPGIRRLGYVDKTHDLPRLLELMRSFHFGCLLSSAEASGFFSLECLRLGVPIIVTAVGGLEDPGEAGIRVAADATADDIAEEIALVLREPERYVRMREAASRGAAYYSWDRTVSEFNALLDGSPE